jgi:excisionase family DNA binding protein
MAAPADTATNPGTPSPPSPLSEPLLDAQAAAALLAVRPSWIYEAVRTGRVPHLKIGRHVRFLRSDLEAWVVDQRRAARP